jgi:hypothetical protein
MDSAARRLTCLCRSPRGIPDDAVIALQCASPHWSWTAPCARKSRWP